MTIFRCYYITLYIIHLNNYLLSIYNYFFYKQSRYLKKGMIIHANQTLPNV